MKNNPYYCEKCLGVGPFNNVCECSISGAHRIVKRGSIEYRVQNDADVTMRMKCRNVPKGWTVIDVIQH